MDPTIIQGRNEAMKKQLQSISAKMKPKTRSSVKKVACVRAACGKLYRVKTEATSNGTRLSMRESVDYAHPQSYTEKQVRYRVLEICLLYFAIIKVYISLMPSY